MASAFDLKGTFETVELKFQMYKDFIRGVAEGRLRHLFVQGPQGIGKTFLAEQILGVYAQRKRIRLHRAAGRSTPLGLYHDLYSMRRPDDITIFDDCDSVFEDKAGLNLLKAATDTRDRRELSWSSSSKAVLVPSFIFEGRIIVLTNVDLLRPKYGPLVSRVHHLKFNITNEEKVARIIQILRDDTKFRHCHDEVSSWLIRHHAEIGPRLDIRTAIKCLELAAFNRDSWKQMAEATILGDA